MSIMKRWSLKPGLFLFAGAIVNVAVAWGCALYSFPQERGEAIETAECARLAKRYGEADWVRYCMGPTRQAQLGVDRFAALYFCDPGWTSPPSHWMAIIEEVR